MRTLYGPFRNMSDDESGQTMVEYALMLALVALVVVAAIPAVTTAVVTLFNNIASALTSAGS